MKKKLFRSFIVSLFVFTLFISVSNADVIDSGVTYSKANISLSNNVDSIGSYNKTTGSSLVLNYINNKETYQTEFDSLFDTVKSSYNVDSYVLYSYSSSQYGVFFYNSSLHEFYVARNNDSLVFMGFVGFRTDTSSTRIFIGKRGSTGNMLNKGYASEDIKAGGFYYFIEDCIVEISNNINNIKILDVTNSSYTGSFTATWDGTSYYYQASSEPEVPAGPEFSTELTDDEIATVVKNFSNSTYWKNRNSNYTGFFIQHNESNGHYAIMVVPNHLVNYKFVEGIYIPANVTTSNYPAMDYDTYSVGHIKTGVPQLPWNQWIESFKIYDSSDGFNFSYVGEMLASEYMKYRIPMTTPIIYSNFTIPFKTLMGETTDENGDITDSFTEESDFDFSNLVNSETGESYEFEDVPVEDNPIIRALGEFFTDLSGIIVSAIGLVIDKLMNLSDLLLANFGENVVTFVFAIIIKAFSVLVSSVMLLIRFAGFLLTLVSIPADSSLFNVLVDGSTWGTHFIEGLNFLKGLSWNNLNLWTFFECFVAAIEIIWTVKIVRRHYSQVV